MAVSNPNSSNDQGYYTYNITIYLVSSRIYFKCPNPLLFGCPKRIRYFNVLRQRGWVEQLQPTAAAIRKVYEESGELSAVVELRRHFPGIADNENARRCVRSIASWQPLPPLPKKRDRTRSSPG